MLTFRFVQISRSHIKLNSDSLFNLMCDHESWAQKSLFVKRVCKLIYSANSTLGIYSLNQNEDRVFENDQNACFFRTGISRQGYNSSPNDFFKF